MSGKEGEETMNRGGHPPQPGKDPPSILQRKERVDSLRGKRREDKVEGTVRV